MTYEISMVLAGPAIPFRGTEASAIYKFPVDGPVKIGLNGLAGDQQADLKVHGGPDKAIHHYPYDHYHGWHMELGGHPLLESPGGFGENISTTGLTEAKVRIGDRFRMGTALVEVAQGRQPCWKIDHKFGQKGITARVLASGRCGWYYRVLEEGEVAAGDKLELVEEGPAQWTVARTFRLLLCGGHKDDPAAIPALAELPQLAESWRVRAAKLAG